MLSDLPPGTEDYDGQDSVLQSKNNGQNSSDDKALSSLEKFFQSHQIKFADGTSKSMFGFEGGGLQPTFLCYPCGATCYSEVSLREHMNGKKHTSKISSKTVWPLNIIKEHPFVLLTNSKIPLPVVETSDSTVEPTTTEPTTTSDDKEEASTGTSHFDGIKSPMVGLEYCIEICHDGSPSEIMCTMCEKKAIIGVVINHIVSHKHKISYLRLHYPKAYWALDKYKNDPKYGSVFLELVNSICFQIEKDYGRQKLLSVQDSEFLANKSKYLELAVKAHHVSERSGKSYIELVDDSFIKAMIQTKGGPSVTEAKSTGQPSQPAPPESNCDDDNVASTASNAYKYVKGSEKSIQITLKTSVLPPIKAEVKDLREDLNERRAARKDLRGEIDRISSRKHGDESKKERNSPRRSRRSPDKRRSSERGRSPLRDGRQSPLPFRQGNKDFSALHLRSPDRMRPLRMRSPRRSPRISPDRRSIPLPARDLRSPLKLRGLDLRNTSPPRRRERSPGGRRERSPGDRRERSPGGRRERSPGGRRERSPIGRREGRVEARRERSPRRALSPLQRNLSPYKCKSPSRIESYNRLKSRSRSPRQRSPFRNRSPYRDNSSSGRGRSPRRLPTRRSAELDSVSERVIDPWERPSRSKSPKQSSSPSKGTSIKEELVIKDLFSMPFIQFRNMDLKYSSQVTKKNLSRTVLFCERIGETVNSMKNALEFHRKNPERHPLYQDEWKKFWNKRYKELKMEKPNIDVNTYNFKPEWVIYWNDRIKDMYEEELLTKKTEICRKLALPNSDAELIPFFQELLDLLVSSARKLTNPPPLIEQILKEERRFFLEKKEREDREFERRLLERKELDRKELEMREKREFELRERRELDRKEFEMRERLDLDRRERLEFDRKEYEMRERMEYRKLVDYPMKRSHSRSGSTSIDLKALHRISSPISDDSMSEYSDRDYKRSRMILGRDSRESTVAELSGKIKSGDDVNVISVLRSLSALETYLGSLGSKVVDLLALALKMEKDKPNSSENILTNDEYSVLFETVKEKLKGQLLAGFIESNAVLATKKAIQFTASLIHMSTKMIELEKRNEENVKAVQKSIPVTVEGIGAVEKAAIAHQIATALVAQGRTNVTTDELESLVNAVVGMASNEETEQPAKESPAPPKPKASPPPINTNALQLLQSAYAAVPTPAKEPVVEEDTSSSTMEGLSDSDLQTLLQNFEDLSSDEQNGLIAYLKKLEKKDSARVERLKKFVSDKSSVAFSKEKSPFAVRESKEKVEEKLQPAPIKPQPAAIKIPKEVVKLKDSDDDDDDYTYDDVMKSASAKVTQDELTAAKDSTEVKAIKIAKTSAGSAPLDINAIMSALLGAQKPAAVATTTVADTSYENISKVLGLVSSLSANSTSTTVSMSNASVAQPTPPPAPNVPNINCAPQITANVQSVGVQPNVTQMNQSSSQPFPPKNVNQFRQDTFNEPNYPNRNMQNPSSYSDNMRNDDNPNYPNRNMQNSAPFPNNVRNDNEQNYPNRNVQNSESFSVRNDDEPNYPNRNMQNSGSFSVRNDDEPNYHNMQNSGSFSNNTRNDIEPNYSNRNMQNSNAYSNNMRNDGDGNYPNRNMQQNFSSSLSNDDFEEPVVWGRNYDNQFTRERGGRMAMGSNFGNRNQMQSDNMNMAGFSEDIYDNSNMDLDDNFESDSVQMNYNRNQMNYNDDFGNEMNRDDMDNGRGSFNDGNMPGGFNNRGITGNFGNQGDNQRFIGNVINPRGGNMNARGGFGGRGRGGNNRRMNFI